LFSITGHKVAQCRIMVADSDALVRYAIASMLATHPFIRLTDELSQRDELLAEVRRQDAEVILVDLGLPPNGGLEAVRRLRELRPAARVVMLGEVMEDWVIAESIRVGARGVLSKDAAREVLIECVSEVYAGRFWVERRGGLDSVRVVQENTRPLQTNVGLRLSEREKQVIGLIVEGSTNRQIAEIIQTSEQVVKNHLSRIFDKVGVYNRLELALYALNHRILTSTIPATQAYDG
jgi:two-component system, NarL family, nitrate/nitrite response regulator NarL